MTALISPVLRIESDQRYLRLWNWLVAALLRQLTLPLVVFLCEQRVDVLHARIHGRCRGALQGRVERGVDAEIFA